MASSSMKYDILRQDEQEEIPSAVKRKGGLRGKLKIVVMVELINIIIFGLCYLSRDILNVYKLQDDRPLAFNITTTFTVDTTNLTLVKSDPLSNAFWKFITQGTNNGLVVLPKAYAKAHNLSLSNLPAPPSQTVFQVDAFHQLHCLERLRGHILSGKYLYQLNPNQTEEDAFSRHSLHCVDYLRQAIMCQADMTLVSTKDDLEFDVAPPRKCRDFGAVRRWVLERRYDYERWLSGIEVQDKKSS